MSIPLPKFSLLKSHCSVVFQHTIYAYSEDGFQSLKIEHGAQWEQLPMLLGTQDAACVHAHHGTPQEALYIVGGRSSNTTMTPENGFTGLQRYVFGTKKWELIKTPDPVLYNVTNHGAIFLEASQQIFTFAGTRWPEDGPSTMTFLINTAEPFTITSISTDTTSPMTAPLMLPWGNDGALVLGTGDQNANLYTYTPDAGGWVELAMKLPSALPFRGQSGAAIIEGDDGTRMLYTFDMSVSPIKVSQTIVKDGNGTVNVRRDEKGLTAANWPTYDESLAPKGPWNGLSVASEGSLVVFSGGNAQDALSMFDARKNDWINATALFENGGTSTIETESTAGTHGPSPIPTETSTPTNTNTPVSDNGKPGLLAIRVLFGVLGGCVAVALLLWLLLRFLRKKRIQSRGRSEEYDDGDADRLSFQDRGVSYMKEAGLARRLTSRLKNGSTEPKSLGGVENSSFIGSQRGSGWSRYFSSNSATNLVNLPSRTYSNATRSSSVYDTESMVNSNTRFPYTSGTSGILPLNVNSNSGDVNAPPPTAGSARSAGLTLNLPHTGLGVDARYFSTSRKDREREGQKDLDRRVSDMTVSSISASSYSSEIHEGMVGKTIWSPVDHHHHVAHVQDSPRGWGVLMRDHRASSVYPESAVTVWPEGSNSREVGFDGDLPDSGSRRKQDGGQHNGISGDMSWLNLKY